MKKESRKKSAAVKGSSAKRPVPATSSLSAAILFDEQCRVLFDTMSQGVIFRDAEGRIISANPAAERILGRTLSDMLGKTIAEVHEQALQEDGTLLPSGSFPADVALRTGQPLIGFVMATLNPVEKEYRWLSVNAMPIVHPGASTPSLVYILFDDITERRRIDRQLREARDHLEHEVQERTRELAGANEELSAQIAVRKKAEASLRQSEERFRRLAENADDLIFLFRVDPERAYEYVSPSAAAITGYTPEEFYADPDLGLRMVHPDDRQRPVDRGSDAEALPRSQTLRLVRKDGRIIWVEQRRVPITDPAGQLVAVQGITRDITDRMAAQEKLRASEKFLQTVIDTEPECVKMLGADGALLMMNRAGLAMIQADSLEQVRSKAAIPLVAPEHQRAFGELLARVFRGESGTLAFEMVGLKGRRLWMDTHMVPLRDEQDRIIAALGITRDITDRKRIEERLRASEASLREAQRLAHVGSWVRDPRTQEVSWSEETFRILGLDPERDTPSYDAFLNAIHPQDRDAVKRALADALKRKRPYDMEFRIVRQDGALRHVQARGEVAFDVSGGPVSIIGTLQDLTERRRAEDLLPKIAERISQKTGKEYFRSLVEFIARELGAEYAFVGEIVGAGDAVRTVALHARGAIADNFTYALADTPCAGVAGKAPCFFPDAIQSAFPRDRLLVDMGVRSYAGIPLFAFDGSPLGILVVLGAAPMAAGDRERVITLLQIFAGRAAAELERRRSEEALLAGEQRYKQLLESVTSYIYTVTVVNGKAMSTVHGPGCVAVTGYTAAEFDADPYLWYRMVHDADKPMVLVQAEDLLAGGRPGPIEHRVRHKNGTFIWVRSVLVPHVDEHSRLTSYDGLITDITAKKRAESLARNILDTVDEGFLIIDRDLTVLSVNKAYSQQTGIDVRDIIGRKCYEVSHQISRPCYDMGEDCAVRHVFETESPHVAVHSHRAPGGELLHVETKAFPLRDDDGHVVAAIEIVQNVTDRTRLEDQLRHSQKMEAVGLLAGGISHDFNNILTAIIGYGNLLKMKIPGDDPLHAYVEQILTTSARAANLTQSLLAFSRKQVINPRSIDVNESIRTFEKLLQRLIGEDVDLRFDLLPGGMTVLADPSQVEQVLMSLATNARDAMPRGGTLTVRTEIAAVDEAFRRTHGFGKPGNYARISVRDTGRGMDKATVARIFEPFFTTKDAGRGTGLGLAIVYGIMKQSNGYVIAESEPGSGSCFSLYFPLIAASQESPAAAAAASADEGHETILVAEDDSTIRELTRTFLSEFGYRVVEAVDGEEAVQKFREHRKDIKLVILDAVMPKKTGKEVRDEIASIDPAVKVLFISGYNADILDAKGFTDAERFIPKPVSPLDLLRAVRRALDSDAGAPAASG